jgi:Flp pilus assembly protein TadD
MPGVVTGRFAPEEVDVDATSAELARAQEILGVNQEPTMWRAVLLARAGRLDEARDDLRRAAAGAPQLTEFYRRLADAGLLPPAIDRSAT